MIRSKIWDSILFTYEGSMVSTPKICMIKSPVIPSVLWPIGICGEFSVQVVISHGQCIFKPTITISDLNRVVILRSVETSGQTPYNPPHSRVQERSDHGVFDDPVHNSTTNQLIAGFASLDPSVKPYSPATGPLQTQHFRSDVFCLVKISPVTV